MAIPSVCGLQVRSVRDNFSPLLLRANLRTFSTTSLFQTRNHQLDTLASSGGSGVDSSGYPQNPALDLGNFPFTLAPDKLPPQPTCPLAPTSCRMARNVRIPECDRERTRATECRMRRLCDCPWNVEMKHRLGPCS